MLVHLLPNTNLSVFYGVTRPIDSCVQLESDIGVQKIQVAPKAEPENLQRPL